MEPEIQKSKNKKPVRVTARELELLKFLAEMKFSNFEVLRRRYFNVLKDGSTSSSGSYARERINALLSLKLIKQCEIELHGMKYFCLTNRGFGFLEKLSLSGSAPRPTGTIDLKNFTHDFEVLLLRTLLEQNSNSFRWISEREILRGDLPFSFRKKFGFEQSFAPDAILEFEESGLTAIEVEISPKSKSRYQEKKLRYVHLIRDQMNDKTGLKQVNYYCITDQAYRAIERETSFFQEYFVVVRHPSLIEQRMFGV